MSAISGYWSFATELDPSTACLKMLAAQKGYGPDRSDYRQFERFAAGRNLFKLLPEDALDTQPIVFGQGRYILVADVRLDNRDELINALRLAGSEIRVADSELLARAYETWGKECLHRLAGDFALAVFDLRNQELFLARDPLGQRPLFWHRGNGFVAFSSMPKGLHALGCVPRRPDLAAATRFLAFLPQSGSQSYYESIHRVEPAHGVTVCLRSSESRRYWNPRRRELRLPKFDDYVEAYRFELDRAVASRLRGTESGAASHLSGGWDSSAVTATAARLLEKQGRNLLAFTAVPNRDVQAAAPPRRFVDEGPTARATAARYPNIEHMLIPNSGACPTEDLDLYANYFERPLYNLCNHVWLAEIRRAVREAGVRVLLTGEVGNWTISAGPATILADHVREGHIFVWTREAAAMLLKRRVRLRGVLANSFGPWVPDALWKRFRRLSSAPELELASLVHPDLRPLVTKQQDLEREGLAWRAKNNHQSTIAGLQGTDWGEYRKGVLGGWGIDKRDATADIRLIEFCLSLPLEMLWKNGERRPLARAALSDRLPSAVLDEPRKGYQAADWSEGLSRNRAEITSLIAQISANPDAASLIDTELLRKLVNNWPQSGWERPDIIARYRRGLLQALSTGHFIIKASGKGQ